MSGELKDFPGKGKKVGVLGIPLGFGAGQKGSEMGSTALRLAQNRGGNLVDHIRDLGYEVVDHGDVDVVKPAYIANREENPKYLAEVMETSRRSAAAVSRMLGNGEIPVLLGGDHSIVIGSFTGITEHFRARNEEVGLLWFDAHADMNTPETSPTGNVHGMPLSALMGLGNDQLVGLGGFAPKINPKYFAHIGARDLDPGEKRCIRDLGLRDRFFTMSDIDKRGIVDCVKDALSVVSQAPGGYAVTFDVDCIDPRFAPGSGTLVRGGITYREAHISLELVAEQGGMRSFEIVEVNPMLDERNITVDLAAELILSALGKTIL